FHVTGVQTCALPIGQTGSLGLESDFAGPFRGRTCAAVSVEDERWSPAAGMSGAWLLCRKNGPVGPFHVADTDPPLPQRTYAGARSEERRVGHERPVL